MGKFLIGLAFVAIAALATNSYISGDTGTVKSETTRAAKNGVAELKKVDGGVATN